MTYRNHSLPPEQKVACSNHAGRTTLPSVFNNLAEHRRAASGPNPPKVTPVEVYFDPLLTTFGTTEVGNE